MKNYQKNFVLPISLGIIALLVISGSVYMYQNKKMVAPAQTKLTDQNAINSVTTIPDSTSTEPSIYITMRGLPTNHVYAGQSAGVNFSGTQPSLCRSPNSCESYINFGGIDIQIGLGSWGFTVPQLSPGIYQVYQESPATGWKGSSISVTILNPHPSIATTTSSSVCEENEKSAFSNNNEYVAGNVEVSFGDSVPLTVAENILINLGYSYTNTLVDSFPRLHILTAIVPVGQEISAACKILSNQNVSRVAPNGISHAN